MKTITFEVPEATDQMRVCIPCGNLFDDIWEFTILFCKNDALNEHVVTILDRYYNAPNAVLNTITKVTEGVIAKFPYHADDSDVDVLISVYYTDEHKMITVTA